MTGIELAMLVPVAIRVGSEAWDLISRLSKGTIPPYTEIISMNKETQDLIDSQKG